MVHNGCVCFPLDKVVSWAWKSGKTFGHTFKMHGKNQYKKLIGRLSSGASKQGHFLDNEKAAKFLESIQAEISIMKPGTSRVFHGLPTGVGEVLTKNATGKVVNIATTSVRVVRGSSKSRSFIKTAYPFIN